MGTGSGTNASPKPPSSDLLDHQRVHIELEPIILVESRDIEHDLTQCAGARVTPRGKIDVPRRPKRVLRREGL